MVERQTRRVSHVLPTGGTRCGQTRRPAYVLLETVLAAGLLVVGLAVIGAQVQDSQKTINKMDRQLRAMRLAEMQLGELEMGLITLDSVDEIAEKDFGPRYPDWGWRVTTEKTSLDNMYMMKLEILYLKRDGDYQENDFDHDAAEVMYTLYVMKSIPAPVSFADDFGMTDDELTELSGKLADIGIEGLDPQAFDLSFFRNVDFEELVKSLPLIMDALGMSMDEFTSRLPPEVVQQLKDAGAFDQGSDNGGEGGGGQ